jgi:nicotinate-nucleotide adenylyltransferase
MRLGIFGGTFDPVHYGHLILAECCREQIALDEVWFLPAAVPPHKQGRELTEGPGRVEMLQLAIGGHPAFEVCRYELERGGVSYTVDTLAEIHRSDPSRELFFLMGADSLRDLRGWKDPARLCQLAIPVVVARAGTPDEALDLSGLAALVSAERLDAIRAHRVVMPTIDLSASDLRKRVAEGRSIRYLTPRAVEKYIEEHGLYRDAPEKSG